MTDRLMNCLPCEFQRLIVERGITHGSRIVEEFFPQSPTQRAPPHPLLDHADDFRYSFATGRTGRSNKNPFVS
jgi:hypothetical protein